MTTKEWHEIALEKIRFGNFSIVAHSGKNEEVIAYIAVAEGKEKEFQDKNVRDVLDFNLGLDIETIEYIRSVPESERRRIKKEAQIAHHKKEIERLSEEIS